MAFTKSDILFMGIKHYTANGKLNVVFESGSGPADLFALREILALFGAQVVGGIQHACRKDTNSPQTNHIMPSKRVTYVTNLDVSELNGLDASISFPIAEKRRADAANEEARKQEAIRNRVAEEQRQREERKKQRQLEAEKKFAPGPSVQQQAAARR